MVKFLPILTVDGHQGEISPSVKVNINICAFFNINICVLEVVFCQKDFETRSTSRRKLVLILI